jgi:predicted RNA-binding Zn-ribbon protein involved in translation (DUF1610 family)
MTTAAAKKHYRIPKSLQSIIINSGVTRQVIVKTCPTCGKDLKGVQCSTILTRFKCPACGMSMENSNENRCRTCFTQCSDSETYNAHCRGGCPNAGKKYPLGLMFRNRDDGVRN